MMMYILVPHSEECSPGVIAIAVKLITVEFIFCELFLMVFLRIRVFLLLNFVK